MTPALHVAHNAHRGARGLTVVAGALPSPLVTWCNQSSSRRSGGGGWRGTVSTVVQTARFGRRFMLSADR
jgi:hypothetical protein